MYPIATFPPHTTSSFVFSQRFAHHSLSFLYTFNGHFAVYRTAISVTRGSMTLLSTGSPKISRKHSGGCSLSSEGGVNARTISSGREKLVSQLERWEAQTADLIAFTGIQAIEHFSYHP